MAKTLKQPPRARPPNPPCQRRSAGRSPGKDLFSDLPEAAPRASPARDPRRTTRALREAGYTAHDIEVLEGLEPVAAPRHVYGGTDEKALHHLLPR